MDFPVLSPSPTHTRRVATGADGVVDALAACTHVVTGATGFIGAGLVLELLRRTGGDVVAVVRAGDSTAEARLRAALDVAVAGYGGDRGLLDRCRAVAGDLLEPGCGVREEIAGPVVFWHCAASLRYENRYEAEIVATNVGGTRHALELAERLKAGLFNYVSTAYVAGAATGEIAEVPPQTVTSNNHYERSKVEAEALVTAATAFRTRILRPSIVVGHSRTQVATTFSGFYGFLRQLVQLRGMLDRAQSGLHGRTILRLRADPEAPLNLVPIDAVAEELVRIGLSDAPDGFFHLTHPDPPPVGRVIRQMCRAVGLADPLFVTDTRDFSWLDEKLDARIDFYRSYISDHKRFSRARADAALHGAPAPMIRFDESATEAYIQWYLARLAAERANLPESR